MHGHTPLTRAHAHSHWCAAPCTLAHTHVHTHPFAHWHALTRTHTHSHTDARPSQPPWPSGVEGRGRFPLASTPVAAHSLVHSLTAVPRSPLRDGRRHVTPSLIRLFPGHPAQCLAGAGPPRVPASEVERGRAQGPAWGGEGHVEGGLSGGGAALRDGVLGTPSPAAPRPRQAALLRPDSAAPTGRDSRRPPTSVRVGNEPIRFRSRPKNVFPWRPPVIESSEGVRDGPGVIPPRASRSSRRGEGRLPPSTWRSRPPRRMSPALPPLPLEERPVSRSVAPEAS